MNKNRVLRPDFIVALLAVIIGLSTMFVYIYQARIMSRQVHATTWPYLETNFSQGDQGLVVSVRNKGVGPAVVKATYVVVDGVRVPENQRSVDSLARALVGTQKNVLTGYTNLNSRVISPGDNIEFIEVKDTAHVAILMKALIKHKVYVEMCYSSVLGDCWQMIGSKTTECKSCD
ncbi:MAG: hypothetical protein ACK514_10575 [Bacteroidota bacterium]|jgi:hypothetical protein